MLLHEETLARYQELRPSQFMECVVFGVLRDHLYTVYTVINVYTRIMISLPATEDLRLTYVPNTILQFPVELRDIMRTIQQNAVQAYNLLNHVNRVNFAGVETSPFFGSATAAQPGRRMESGMRFSF